MAGPAPDAGRLEELVAATSAASRAIGAAGLRVLGAPTALPGVANVVLAFRDIGVVAKVATRTHAKGRLPTEHAIATELAALSAPAPRPLQDVGPVADPETGFLVTLWHYLDHDPTVAAAPADCVAALCALHDALDATTTPVPSFLLDVGQARAAADNDEFVAALASDDRSLLRGGFDGALAWLESLDLTEHRLHGEPHEANRLVTPGGVVWVDFESCCVGPREWDLAFMAHDAISGLDVDSEVLACARLLKHARFAAWRWGLVARYPDLREHAESDLAYVKAHAKHF